MSLKSIEKKLRRSKKDVHLVRRIDGPEHFILLGGFPRYRNLMSVARVVIKGDARMFRKVVITPRAGWAAASKAVAAAGDDVLLSGEAFSQLEGEVIW